MFYVQYGSEYQIEYQNYSANDNFVTVSFIIDGQLPYEIQITKDYNYLVQATNFEELKEQIEQYKALLDAEANNTNNPPSGNTGVQPSEVPRVELFIMSYCPYGLQAQKVFLPVYELLGDKADIEVNFLNYVMHEKKEIDENLKGGNI